MAKRFLTTAELSKIKFNQSSDVGLQQGEMIYDSEHLALMFGLSPNVKMELGQSTVILVYNNTFSEIPAGRAVYGVGVENERPSVIQSVSSSMEQSSRTFGITAEAIPAAGYGWVVTQGILSGVDTSTYLSGDELWLSPTTPGVLVTTPTGSPNYDLLLGYCIVSASVNGSIYVSFFRGVDVEGIHDIVLTGLASGDILRYNSASGYWQNEPLSALGGGATVSDTPPSTPSAGDIWFNSSTAETFIYYDSTWVEVGEGGGGASGSLSDIENIAFNTSSPFYTVGQGDLSWDDGEGTLSLGLKGGNVTLQLGQENVALCYNGTGSPIPDGTAVYISGAQGQRPRISLAQANAEATSSKILGVTTETIADGAEGFVATFGIVNDIDTSAFTAGDALWLSASVAGGITKVKPTAPNHLVFIGYAIKINASSGRIFVNPQNGYEVDELHDVLVTSKTDRDVLMYNSASGLWINEQINLGTDTVGNYVASVSGTDGVSISGTGEGAAVSIANSDKGSSQNIFKNITDGSNTASAEINNDTFTLTASTGMGIVVNPTTDTATFVNTGVTSFSAGTTGLTPSTGTTGSVTLAGTLAAANGGTGQSSYAVGDILYASTTSALSKLADVATGNALISGGVGVAPSWGKIGLGTHISGTLGVANGGTGLSASATNGQLLIGNGTGYTLATLTQGTGITVTNGAGTISIANAGVTSVSGTANEIEVSASTGSVTVGLPNNVTIGNDLIVTGNLTVNGTTTTVNSTTMTVDDPIITLGGDTAPVSNDAKDRGIEFRYFDSVARLGFMGWDNSASSFVLLTAATNTSEVFTGTKGTLDAFISGSNINAGTVSATYIDSAIARLSSPTFTGTPAAPTAAVDTNTTQIATTAFVIGQGYLKASSASTTYAPLASPTFTGTVTAATLDLTTAATATTATSYWVETGSDGIVRPKTLANVRTEIVTTAAVNSASATTLGTVTVGTWNAAVISGTYIDTAIARLASPTFTGTPAAPTAAVDTNTTQIATTAYVVGQGYAKLASPTFTGTPAAPTAAVDTNTTQIATTAFVIGQGYLKSATASSTYAPLASPTFTGVPAAPTAAADTNTTQIATTAFVVGQAGSASPLINGTATVGTSLRYSRQDHVHPTDTSRAPTASPTFTGTITTPLTTAGYVTTTAGGVLGSVATIPNAGLTNSSVTIGSTSVSLGGTATTVAGLTLTSPVIDTVAASAASASPLLWSTVTTGSIGIGQGLTTGTLNIATVGTGVTPISIGHTNATLAVTTSGFNLTTAGALTLSSTISASGLAGSLLSSASPLVNGTAAAGTSAIPSRQDHVHPTDTSRAPTASPTFTGTVTTPLTTAGYVTTTAGGVLGSVATIPNAGLTNSSVTIGSTAVSLGGTASTIAGLTLTSPIIDTVAASAAAATPVLWSTVTTGSIGIGQGLTTGALNIATVGTGVTPISIGHTNATLAVTTSGFNLTTAGALTLSSTIAASGLAGSLLSSTSGSALGAASAGTSTIPARADHVHPTTGLGLTSGTLAQFAATTSAQLAGVISDETGFSTGALLVFSISPALTGTPTAPTAVAGTNTTQIATTEFVQTAVSSFTSGPDYSTQFLLMGA